MNLKQFETMELGKKFRKLDMDEPNKSFQKLELKKIESRNWGKRTIR
jgi:hypothetical protein